MAKQSVHQTKKYKTAYKVTITIITNLKEHH